MDVLDSPYLSQKQRKPRSKNNFQTELQEKLNARRKQGLAADLTSEDSDAIPEDTEIADDGEEDDFLAQYRLDNKKSSNRPGSAKRRSPYLSQENELSLGDTIRPGQGSNRFMKKSNQGGMPPLSSPKGSSRDQKGMPALSPKGSSGLTDTLRMDSGMGFSPKGNKTPPQMSKADMLFGRKTPTYDQQRQSPVDKQWQQPTMRKASPVLDASPDQSPAGSARGRTTPSSLEPLLKPINETPSPRQRKSSGGLIPKSTKPVSFDSEPPRAKPRTKTDIFGKTSTVEVDLSDEEDKEVRNRFSKSGTQSRFGDKGRQTPTSMGRKTPTQGRKTPTKDLYGRKTPPPAESAGRKTPTRFTKGARGENENNVNKNASEKPRKESIFDFLNEDVEVNKKDDKPKLLQSTFDDNVKDDSVSFAEREHEKRNPRQSRREKEKKAQEQKPTLEQLSYTAPNDRIPTDQSSICAEVEHDPTMKLKEKPSAAQRKGKSFTNAQTNDQILEMVADEQEARRNEPGIKPISPEKTKDKSNNQTIVKPKPRHSLPGTPKSTSLHELDETNLNSTKHIRDAIYAEWKKEKLKMAKEKQKEEEKKQKEKEDKEKKEKEDKEKENQLSYNAWMEEKKGSFDKEQRKKKRLEEEKKLKEEKEKEEKRKQAEKNFQIWKESKDEKIAEEDKKKAEAEKKKKMEEKKLKDERKELAKTAARGWNKKKEEEIKKKQEEENRKKKTLVKDKILHKKKQEEQAEDLYQKWLQDKEKQMKKEKRMKSRSTEYIDERPSWSPASRTIPFGR